MAGFNSLYGDGLPGMRVLKGVAAIGEIALGAGLTPLVTMGIVFGLMCSE